MKKREFYAGRPRGCSMGCSRPRTGLSGNAQCGADRRRRLVPYVRRGTRAASTVLVRLVTGSFLRDFRRATEPCAAPCHMRATDSSRSPARGRRWPPAPPHHTQEVDYLTYGSFCIQSLSAHPVSSSNARGGDCSRRLWDRRKRRLSLLFKVGLEKKRQSSFQGKLP